MDDSEADVLFWVLGPKRKESPYSSTDPSFTSHLSWDTNVPLHLMESQPVDTHLKNFEECPFPDLFKSPSFLSWSPTGDTP